VDGDARIVVDPGMVADRSEILEPLAAHGLAPEDVTHVFLTHHHPDHALNTGLFPNAAVVDFWATYHGTDWIDHEGDGHHVSPNVHVMLTPGHTNEDATLLVETDDGTVACTHLWWHADRTPEVDPLADDQAALETSRARVLEVADVVVPGHGPAFRVTSP
jgi:glyoxylase-like metal-dependent hydrolase (beta-lactamase superfamily II)